MYYMNKNECIASVLEVNSMVNFSDGFGTSLSIAVETPVGFMILRADLIREISADDGEEKAYVVVCQDRIVIVGSDFMFRRLILDLAMVKY